MNRSQIHRVLEAGVHWSLTALVTFPLLPLRLATLVTFIYGGISLLHFALAKHKSFDRVEVVTAACFFALPILYLTEIPFADNPDYVWREVQRKMGLLVFPLLFILNSAAGFRFRVTWYMNVFSLAALLVMIRVSAYLLLFGLDPEQLSSGGFAFALRTAAQEVSGLHPTYAGLIIGIAVSYSLKQALEEYCETNIAKVFLVLGSFIGVTFISMLGARIALLATALATIAVIWRSRSSSMSKWIYTGTSITAVVIAAIVFPTFRDRFLELLSTAENSTNVRSMIYSCSVELIKDNWMFGVGVERLQHYLDICYQQFAVFSDKRYFQYNTHNEYFNVLAAKGVFGLIALSLVFGRILRFAKQLTPLLAFALMFGIVCLTENLLERQVGVFTLSIIGGMLIMQVQQKRPKGV